MRLVGMILLAVPMVGLGSTSFAQPAPASPLFGQTCTGAVGTSVVRHMFFVRNGAPFVHIWAKFPNGKNEFGDGGEAPVTVTPNGALEFTSARGFKSTVVPDGKGKGEVTTSLTLGRSQTGDYDECHPSS